MFDTYYRAVCETCRDVCEWGGNSHSPALVMARQMGWQGQAKQWLFGGVEVDWDFYCPTHRTDME